MLFDKWDNIRALRGYRGQVDIYGASQDIVIPINHAKNLAASTQGSHFKEINCGHNEWSDRGYVDLRR